MNSNLIKVAMCLMLVGGAVNIQHVESMEDDSDKQGMEIANSQNMLDEQALNENNNNIINADNNNFVFGDLMNRIDALKKDFNTVNENMSAQTKMDDLTNMIPLDVLNQQRPNFQGVNLSFEEQVRRQYGLVPVSDGDYDQKAYYFNYFQRFDENPGALSLEDLIAGYNNFVEQYRKENAVDIERDNEQKADKRALDELQAKIAQLTAEMKQHGFKFYKSGQLIPGQDLRTVAEISFYKQFGIRYGTEEPTEEQQENYKKTNDELVQMQKKMQEYNRQLAAATSKSHMSLNLYKSSHASLKNSKEILYNMLRELKFKGQKTYDNLDSTLNNYDRRKQICKNHLSEVQKKLKDVQSSLDEENKSFKMTKRDLDKQLEHYAKERQNEVKQLEVKSESANHDLQHAKTMQKLKTQEDILSKEVNILNDILQNDYQPIDKIVNDKGSKTNQYRSIYKTVCDKLNKHDQKEERKNMHEMQRARQTQRKYIAKKELQSNYINTNKEQIGKSSITLKNSQSIFNNNKVSSSLRTTNKPQPGLNITQDLSIPKIKKGDIVFDQNVFNNNFNFNENEKPNILSENNNVVQGDIKNINDKNTNDISEIMIINKDNQEEKNKEENNNDDEEIIDTAIESEFK